MMLNNKQKLLLLLISISMGGVLTISFVSHILGLFQDVNFENFFQFFIWGGLFSIITYNINKAIWLSFSSGFPSQFVVLSLITSLFISFFILWMIWKPPLLPITYQEPLDKFLIAGANILDIFESDIKFIWKIMVGSVFIADYLSLSWLIGILILVMGIFTSKNKFPRRGIAIVAVLRKFFPYVILMVGLIMGNLTVFRFIESQNYYHLRKLEGNTLDELVRKSSDTSPLLRVYITYHQYYPGSILFIVDDSLEKTGLTLEDLWARASVKELHENDTFPMISELDRDQIKELSQTMIDVESSAISKKFYFIAPDAQPVDEVLLITDGENVFFIPKGFTITE
jgi:hypothetical protein